MLDKVKKTLKKLSTVIFGMVMVFGIFAVSPISVYADDETTYTITFKYNDPDGTVKTLEKKKGETLTYAEFPKPDDIVYEGDTYWFNGWDGYTSDYSTTVTGNLTINGTWIPEYTVSIPAEVSIDTTTGKGQFDVEASIGKYTCMEILAGILDEDGNYNETFDMYGTGTLKCGEKELPFTISDVAFRPTSSDEKKTVSKTFYITVDDSNLDNYAGTYETTLNFEINAEMNNSDTTGNILTIYPASGIEEAYLNFMKEQNPDNEEIQSMTSFPVSKKTYVVSENYANGDLILNSDSDSSGYSFYRFNENTMKNMAEALGFNFVGWYTEPNGKGTKLDEASTYDGIHNDYYAYWGYAITFNMNDGTNTSETINVEKGNSLNGTLPTPKRDGYVFQGWYTEKDGGTQITEDMTYDGTYTNLYAHWKEQYGTVTFDWNDGNGTTTNEKYEFDKEFGTLPTPTRGNAEFLGWYTKKVGGDLVTKDSVFKENTTLYAHWDLEKITLVDGITFNKLIDKFSVSIEKIVFSSKEKSDNITSIVKLADIADGNSYSYQDYATTAIDFSKEQNGSIIAWVETGETDGYYNLVVSTQNENNIVAANSDSSYMFANLEMPGTEEHDSITKAHIWNIDYSDGYTRNDIKQFDFSNFDTSNVTNMEGMFLYSGRYHSRISGTLDLSNFDTSNVTNMSYMFFQIVDETFGQGSELTKIDLSSFDTSKVTDMSYMFAENGGSSTLFVNGLDLSSFNTSNVTNMEGMFRSVSRWNCETSDSLINYTNLVKNFNTSNVTNMSYMFFDDAYTTQAAAYTTQNLANFSETENDYSGNLNLDLSNFDTSKVTDMSYMFAESSFEKINVISFDTSNVTNMEGMFSYCGRLLTLNLSSFDTSKAKTTDKIFNADVSWAQSDHYGTQDYASSLRKVTLGEKCTAKIVLPKDGISTLGYWQNSDLEKFENTEIPTGAGTYTVAYLPLQFAVHSNGNEGDAESDLSKVTRVEFLNGTIPSSVTTLYNSFDSKNKYSTYVSGTSYFWMSDCGGLIGYIDGTTLKIYSSVENATICYTGDWLLSSNIKSYNFENFDTSFAATMKGMFSGFAGTKLDVSKLNTSNVTDMSYMFEKCQNLISLCLSNFDTSKVTDFSYMFSGCESLTSLDLSNFDTSNVEGMQGMFESCKSLVSLDLSNFNTSKVTKMSQMFSNCSSLEELNLSSFDTSNLESTSPTSFALFFYNNKSLAKISVGDEWAKVINFPNVGHSSDGNWTAISDGTIYAYNAIPTEKADTYVIPIAVLFDAGDGLLDSGSTSTIINLSVGRAIGDLPVPTKTGYIFKGWYTDENYTTQVTSDTIYDGTYAVLYAKYVAGYELMGVAFTSGNENIDIMGAQLENSNFDLSSIFDTSNGLVAKLATVSNLTKATSIVFTDKAPATGTTTVDVSKNQDGTVLAYVDSNTLYIAPSTDGTKIYAPESAKCLFTAPVLLGASVTSIDMSNLDTSYTTDMSYMFFYGYYLQSIDLSQLDTSNVTDMNGMFTMCISLTSLDLSPLNTSKVTNMAWMFAQMQLTSLDLSPLNTTNVTDMSGMFVADTGLTSLDLSPLDTSNVTDMKYMFSSCTNLTSLDLSPLKTSKVTNMSAMFAGDYNLTELDVTPLDTSNVTNMSMMFQTLIHVKSLDVSGFNTSKVTDMSKMFYYDYHGVQTTDGDTELAEIKGLENWDTSSVTNMEEMFNDLASLKELNLSSFDTSRVTDMTDMFENCDSLTTIYASDKFVTTSLETSGNTMFNECAKLVGGSGTTYSKDHNGADYAHLDGGTDNPGYFTDISAKPSTTSDEDLDDTGISLASEIPSDIVSDSADEIKGESNVVWNATEDEYTLPKSNEIENDDSNDADGIADSENATDNETGTDSAEETSNDEPLPSIDSPTSVE